MTSVGCLGAIGSMSRVLVLGSKPKVAMSKTGPYVALSLGIERGLAAEWNHQNSASSRCFTGVARSAVMAPLNAVNRRMFLLTARLLPVLGSIMGLLKEMKMNINISSI